MSAALNAVSAKLTTQDLIDLLTKVEVDKQDPDAAAKAWLTSKGCHVTPTDRPCLRPEMITVP